MKKAAFLFFRVEVRNAACAVQYLVVVQTMLVRCPKNLDFTMFQKVSLSNLIFITSGYQRDPQESKERMMQQLSSILPDASAQQITKILKG